TADGEGVARGVLRRVDAGACRISGRAGLLPGFGRFGRVGHVAVVALVILLGVGVAVVTGVGGQAVVALVVGLVGLRAGVGPRSPDRVTAAVDGDVAFVEHAGPGLDDALVVAAVVAVRAGRDVGAHGVHGVEPPGVEVAGVRVDPA